MARGGEHQIAREELRLMKAAGIGWARTAFDHLGRPRPVALKNGRGTMQIRESILYLVGPENVVVTPVE